MVTRPVLRDDFPFIKGMNAIYFVGVLLIILSAAIVFLFYSMKKLKKA